MADLAGDETTDADSDPRTEHPPEAAAAPAEVVEDQGPPPMLIKGVRAPERRVGKVTGDMSEADARALSVSISCGVTFSSRKEAMNADLRRMSYAAREPVRGSWPHERPLPPPAQRRGELFEQRAEVYVVMGKDLVMACPSGPHGVCLVAHASCDGCRPGS